MIYPTCRSKMQLYIESLGGTMLLRIKILRS